VRYNGVDNLMEILNKEDNRGYRFWIFLFYFGPLSCPLITLLFFISLFYGLSFWLVQQNAANWILTNLRMYLFLPLLTFLLFINKNAKLMLWRSWQIAACCVRYWDLVWNPPGQKTGIFDV
jgi:hypothetical protein